MTTIREGILVEFDYINWKGQFSHRRGIVKRIYFGSTEHHPEEQLLIEMLDLDKNKIRQFAAKYMTSVRYW